ncbi:MAG: hypothetical protein NTW86_28100 [Candidatus Sumerlaeota bacterium]|nr:hypothetical protein [Candidatus Sumerlaeota bacterium]
MRNRRAILAAAFAILGGGLWLGATTGSAPTPNPDYETVTSKLDPGGQVFVYLDVEGVVQRAIDQIEPILAANPQAAMFVPLARGVVEALGLNDLDDVGASLAPREAGINRQKVYLRLKQWRGLFGLLQGEPRALEAVRFIPADAAYASATSVDFQKVMPLAEQVSTITAGPAGPARLEQALQMGIQQGVDVKAILGSLGGEMAVYVRLDAVNKVQLPLDASKRITAPRPSFAAILQTKNNTLLDLFKKKDQATPNPSKPIDAGPGVEAYQLVAPENPVGFKPVLAQLDGWIIFASDAEELRLALAAREKKAGILEAEECRALMRDMPAAFNGFEFASARINETLADLLKQAESAISEPEARAGMAWFGTLLGLGEAGGKGRVGLRVNDPQGILWVRQGDVHAPDLIQSFFGAPAAMPAIMAAVAEPNFLEAQTRSKVSRTKADMRTMAVALESYYVDNNTYPTWTTDPKKSLMPPQPDGKPVPSFAMANGARLMTLTTPIAYITSYPLDVFAEGRRQPFGYYAVPAKKNGPTGWLLFSPGPDQKWDLNWEAYDPSVTQPSPEMIKDTYDPTNGTVSGGDIIRVKQ